MFPGREVFGREPWRGEMGVVSTLAWAVRLMGLKCFVSQ